MELFRRSTRIDVREVEIVLLTGVGGVAEHRADLATILNAADGAIVVARTGTLRSGSAYADLDATAGGGRTVVIDLTRESRSEFTFFLYAAERFAVFETRVVYHLRLPITPINRDLAKRHLFMRGPGVETQVGFVLTATT